MFENNCIECWNWIINFLRQIFMDTSLEGLSKSLIVLITIVMISYGIFSIFSYVGNIGANLVRKAVLPVALITLLLLSLTMLAQYRKDKTCRFSAERYLTECIPKKSDVSTEQTTCPTGTSFSDICKQSQTDATNSKKIKGSWESAITTSAVSSWNTVSTPPKTNTPPAVNSWNSVSTPPKTKSSTTKPLKTQSIASRSAKKNCNPPQKLKSTASLEPECETTNRSWEAGDVTKPKERDYSKD